MKQITILIGVLLSFPLVEAMSRAGKTAASGFARAARATRPIGSKPRISVQGATTKPKPLRDAPLESEGIHRVQKRRPRALTPETRHASAELSPMKQAGPVEEEIAKHTAEVIAREERFEKLEDYALKLKEMLIGTALISAAVGYEYYNALGVIDDFIASVGLASVDEDESDLMATKGTDQRKYEEAQRKREKEALEGREAERRLEERVQLARKEGVQLALTLAEKSPEEVARILWGYLEEGGDIAVTSVAIEAFLNYNRMQHLSATFDQVCEQVTALPLSKGGAVTEQIMRADDMVEAQEWCAAIRPRLANKIVSEDDLNNILGMLERQPDFQTSQFKDIFGLITAAIDSSNTHFSEADMNALAAIQKNFEGIIKTKLLHAEQALKGQPKFYTVWGVVPMYGSRPEAAEVNVDALAKRVEDALIGRGDKSMAGRFLNELEEIKRKAERRKRTGEFEAKLATLGHGDWVKRPPYVIPAKAGIHPIEGKE